MLGNTLAYAIDTLACTRLEQSGFASIHDPIDVRLGFMTEGGGNRTSNSELQDLEKCTLQIFSGNDFACASLLLVRNCFKGQPCVGKTDVLLD